MSIELQVRSTKEQAWSGTNTVKELTHQASVVGEGPQWGETAEVGVSIEQDRNNVKTTKTKKVGRGMDSENLRASFPLFFNTAQK